MIRKALEYIRGHYEGHDLAGIVLVSDGAATGGFDEDSGDGAVRDFLRSLDTRVHTVWAARPGLKDVAVAKVMADEFAFVRTVVRIDAVIRTTGLPARQVPVTLSTDGQPLRQKLVELPAGDHDVKVTFEVTPPRVGRYVYEISVPIAPNEAVTTNNTRSFVVRVIRDKIRVLQVAGAAVVGRPRAAPDAEEQPQRRSDLVLHPAHAGLDLAGAQRRDVADPVPDPRAVRAAAAVVRPDHPARTSSTCRTASATTSRTSAATSRAVAGSRCSAARQSFTSGGYYGTPVADGAAGRALRPVRFGPDPRHRQFQPQLTDAGLDAPGDVAALLADDNRAALASSCRRSRASTSSPAPSPTPRSSRSTRG